MILEATVLKTNNADQVSSPHGSANLHCASKSSSSGNRVEKLNIWKPVNRAEKQIVLQKETKPKWIPVQWSKKTY